MAQNTKLDIFVRNSTPNDWRVVEDEYNRLTALKDTEELKAESETFKNKYGFSYNSLYPYLKMREILFSQLSNDNSNSAELEALRAENARLKEELNDKPIRKIKYRKVTGQSYKIQLYATKESAALFNGLIESVADETGLVKFRATALIFEEVAKLFTPKK